jgi:peptide-methionine (R)-S-oxide reductase
LLWLSSAELARLFRGIFVAKPVEETFEVVKTDDEWKRLLSPVAYKALRHEGTEAPFSSPLNSEKRPGTYLCGACALPLFSSDAKFESGTGWPSFWAPLADAVRTREDGSLFMMRTEVHCRRCGGHLGHVFDDGPPPTGQRYCMNGVAMGFEPKG